MTYDPTGQWSQDWTQVDNQYNNQFSTDNSGVQLNNANNQAANSGNFMLNNPGGGTPDVFGPQNINAGQQVNGANNGLLQINPPSFDQNHWNQDFRQLGMGNTFQAENNPMVNAYNSQFGDIGNLNTEAVDKYNQQFGDINAINQEQVTNYNQQFDPTNTSGNFNIENEDETWEDSDVTGQKRGWFGKPGGFGSGEGWLSRIGKGGEGFMGKFGTGKGFFDSMGKGVSKIGAGQKSYDYDLY